MQIKAKSYLEQHSKSAQLAVNILMLNGAKLEALMLFTISAIVKFSPLITIFLFVRIVRDETLFSSINSISGFVSLLADPTFTTTVIVIFLGLVATVIEKPAFDYVALRCVTTFENKPVDMINASEAQNGLRLYRSLLNERFSNTPQRVKFSKSQLINCMQIIKNFLLGCSFLLVIIVIKASYVLVLLIALICALLIQQILTRLISIEFWGKRMTNLITDKGAVSGGTKESDTINWDAILGSIFTSETKHYERNGSRAYFYFAFILFLFMGTLLYLGFYQAHIHDMYLLIIALFVSRFFAAAASDMIKTYKSIDGTIFEKGLKTP